MNTVKETTSQFGGLTSEYSFLQGFWSLHCAYFYPRMKSLLLLLFLSFILFLHWKHKMLCHSKSHSCQSIPLFCHQHSYSYPAPNKCESSRHCIGFDKVRSFYMLFLFSSTAFSHLSRNLRVMIILCVLSVLSTT